LLDIDPSLKTSDFYDFFDNHSEYSLVDEPLLPQFAPRYRGTNPPTNRPNMSTRRTTRATSRQADSRGASPAVSVADIPATPRRVARRSGNAPLPAVGLRASTAYGTNTVPQPVVSSGPQVSEQLTNVLDNLLQPIRQNETANSKFKISFGTNLLMEF